MPRPVQGEAQAPGAIGSDQQGMLTALKRINLGLALGRRQSAGENTTVFKTAVQHLSRSHEGRKHDHRLALGQQRSHQGPGGWKFVIGADLAQGREHGQQLGIAAHLTEGSPTAIVVDLDLQPVLKAAGRRLIQLNWPQLAQLGGQVEAILLTAMQHQGPHQPLQVFQMAGPVRLPEAPSALLAPMALAEEFLKGPLVAGEGVADRRQQGK